MEPMPDAPMPDEPMPDAAPHPPMDEPETNVPPADAESSNNSSPVGSLPHLYTKATEAEEEKSAPSPNGAPVPENDEQDEPMPEHEPESGGAAPAEESDEPIRWESDKAPADAKPVDGFEVKRVGNTDRKAKILIAVKHKPERYKPKPELSRLLGLDLETRPRLIAALWQYCRLNDLLDKEDATLVALDDRLRSLFYKGSNGEKQSAKFVDLCEMMCAGCLDPAPPVELDYVVRTRGRKNPTHPDCYDLLVDVPGGDKAPHIFVEGIGRDAEIAALDAKIQAGIKKIEKHLQRRSYFLGFSHSPVDFINTVVAQQARDIAIVRNDGRKRRLAERRTEFYNKPWVDEAVMQYVTRQSKAGKI